MSQSDVIKAVRYAAKEVEVDEDLAVAIAMVESACAWPLRSYRFEPEFRYFYKVEEFAEAHGITVVSEKILQASSWGPMHVMGVVARELGFDKPLQLLFGLESGAHYGCLKLKQLSDRYEKEDSIISSYNAGSVTLTLDKKYRNQDYVDRVKSRLVKLRCINGIGYY